MEPTDGLLDSKIKMIRHEFFHGCNLFPPARSVLLAVVAVILVSSIPFRLSAAEEDVLDIGSRRELFVDSYLIDQLTGEASQRLHHPIPREIAIVHEEEWEGTASGYHSIFKDGDIYRMYYKAWNIDISSGKIDMASDPIYCCYAESKDGIHWIKPDLGIYEYQGSQENNIVLFPGQFEKVAIDPGHPAFFRDDNPACPAESKYKCLILSRKTHGLHVLHSADGIHWSPMIEEAILTQGKFDSQNLAFWDSVRKEYRVYWRISPGDPTRKSGRIRSISTATSKDFIHWGPPTELTYVDSPSEELYTSQIKSYHRAPHLFLGFPARYVERGWSHSMRQLPELAGRERRSKISDRYGTALSETLFMSSRNGSHFKRWNEAFVPPGIERVGTWQYGHQFAGWHLVETRSSLEGDAPNELSLYLSERYWEGKGSMLRRHTIRMDGFVSIHAPRTGGELITKPFTFTGKELSFNFSTSAVGGLKVELQHPDGTVIEGYSLNDSDDLFGNTLSRKVTWKEKGDLSKLAEIPIRLRITLDDADLFSIKFE